MDTEKNVHTDEEKEIDELHTENVDSSSEEENQDPAVEPVFLENEEENADDRSEESNTDLASLQEKVAQLEKEVEEKENRILRVQADFDNYRRRTRQDIENIEKYRSQSLALEIINAVDNFERALQTEAQSDEAKSVLKGMEMIYQSILDALKKEGVEPIESVGKEFNPEFHHAVMQDSNPDVESNIILEEFQKGYKLKERVIRPAMVKVNQ